MPYRRNKKRAHAEAGGARAHQGCCWMSSMLARLAGSATRMRVSRSLQSALTGMLPGKRKSTARMRSSTWPGGARAVGAPVLSHVVKSN